MKSPRTTRILINILLAVMLVMFFYVMYKMWYPYEPVKAARVLVNSTSLHRGDVIGFLLDGEKMLPVPVEITIELTNGENYPIMHYHSNLPVGKLYKWRHFIIPLHVIPGKYRVHWTGVYEMNAVNTVRRSYYSCEVEIK